MKTRIYLLVFLFFGIQSSALALEAKNILGNYELQGVMEMAGGLKLLAGGKYMAGFSYGAADWVEEGQWKIEGEEVVFSNPRFQFKNTDSLSFFIPEGSRFRYQTGKLQTKIFGKNITFINPNKTPSSENEAGEGRMRVKGKVVKFNNGILSVQVKQECLLFNTESLPEKILKRIKIGGTLDAEIAYSAMLGSESCL